MRINCNTSAHISNNQLNKAQTALSKSIERLSSGYKINHAEDDAAGMAIAKKMRTQIKALERASDNASDGVAVVQTAEGALNEVESMLQRARELAVQAADGTYSDEDRVAIQAEIDQLIAEVDRVSTDTEYNTTPILDGSLSRRAYPNTDNVSVLSMSPSVTSQEYTFDVTQPAKGAELLLSLPATITEDTAGVININGSDITLKVGDTTADIEGKIKDLGYKASINTTSVAGSIQLTGIPVGSAESITVRFANVTQAAAFGATGLTPENPRISANGQDCQVTLGAGFNTATARAEGNVITIRDVNNFEMVIEVPKETTLTDCTIKVTEIGTFNIQAGAQEGQQIAIDIPKINSHTLGIDEINCRTTYGASRAIEKMDEAISRVSATRSKLGAYQNRLETTVDSLKLFDENITSALSSIEDCDMAEEMTNYSSKSVLSQAATSILAQANERPQTVLQLLS